MKINQNLLTLKPSATLQINEKVRFLKKAKRYITLDLVSHSPRNSNITKEQVHYLPVNGLDILRAKIASFLEKNQGISTQGSSIFIGPGSKELLYQSILILKVIFLFQKLGELYSSD